jgi:hypothetical protein
MKIGENRCKDNEEKARELRGQGSAQMTSRVEDFS